VNDSTCCIVQPFNQIVLAIGDFFCYLSLVAVGDWERVFARCFGHLCLNDSEAQIADSGVSFVAFPQARQEQLVLQVSLCENIIWVTAELTILPQSLPD
jgi:hypothetical protein